MVLNYIKNYFLLKLVKNNLHNVKANPSSSTIQTVGLLLDESYFFEKDALVSELISNGILKNNISILVYKDKPKKTEDNAISIFGLKNLNWNAHFTNSDINNFIDEKFDILVSYYDMEKAFLLKVTQKSKAKFKVGFSSIDKRLNHLMINTNAENHTVFVHELFRYLKILKKI